MADNEHDESVDNFGYPRNKEELEKYFKKNYKFTQKEQQILSECYDSAFYIRGVPLGIGLTIMVEIGVRNGYIKPPRMLGPLSTALIGGTCGIFLGIFSATSTCYDKLRQSPHSMYGRYLQEKKYGNFYFDYESTRLQPHVEPASNNVNDRFSQPNVLNLDLERPDAKDVDDFRRFPNDDSVENMRYVEHPNPLVSYEQLRKKNRDAYAKTTEYKYDRIISESGPDSGDSMRRISQAEPKPLPKADAEEHSSVGRNKYGDRWH